MLSFQKTKKVIPELHILTEIGTHNCTFLHPPATIRNVDSSLQLFMPCRCFYYFIIQALHFN